MFTALVCDVRVLAAGVAGGGVRQGGLRILQFAPVPQPAHTTHSHACKSPHCCNLRTHNHNTNITLNNTSTNARLDGY